MMPYLSNSGSEKREKDIAVSRFYEVCNGGDVFKLDRIFNKFPHYINYAFEEDVSRKCILIFSFRMSLLPSL
jgi:hypothetical protein